MKNGKDIAWMIGNTLQEKCPRNFVQTVRKMTAAPELLEALEALLHQVDYMGVPEDHIDIINAREAINKAKGK